MHYYWGVPFCPRGLQPDSYTQVRVGRETACLRCCSFIYPSFFQVILAQMEVYEKSLKRAQRRLLRKAEWGEAIVPQPEVPPLIIVCVRSSGNHLTFPETPSSVPCWFSPGGLFPTVKPSLVGWFCSW